MKAINRIKAVLAEKQVSGKWLANEIGRTENTVSRWCANKRCSHLLKIYLKSLKY